MKKNVFYCAAILLLSVFILQSCQSKQNETRTTAYVESRMGKDALHLLRNAESATTFLVRLDPVAPNYKAVSQEKPLSSQSIKDLKNLILNDNHYTIGMTKLAVFLPTVAFKFQTENLPIFVVFSPSGNQLKLFVGEQSVLMNYDPAKTAFEDFLQNFNNNKE